MNVNEVNPYIRLTMRSVLVYPFFIKKRIIMDYELIYFTNESKDECLSVMNAYNNNEKAPDDFTRGLYFRKVL